ncbi:hypothetical protein NDU88_007630 [Pleurodeles waltl]|uniref:Uncharacterized protein n=1 Tax=Pleurodeles waltl TaxID=8319 RepID=A0AAV7STG7_PLEWA|nr:hypothetical protein NDU88_007630 [Pleurodeles waltl]
MRNKSSSVFQTYRNIIELKVTEIFRNASYSCVSCTLVELHHDITNVFPCSLYRYKYCKQHINSLADHSCHINSWNYRPCNNWHCHNWLCYDQHCNNWHCDNRRCYNCHNRHCCNQQHPS